MHMHAHSSADHDHHHHGPANYNKAFAIGAALNVVFIVAEVLAGFWASSMALLADAGHNLSDVLGLLLAWGASYLVHARATKRRTYGLRRSTILAALANAITLLAAIGAIAYEAIHRLYAPEPVTGSLVIYVALIGVVINTATALLFVSGRHDDLNIKATFLHMAADAGVSVGVAIAGVIILNTGWQWIDPVVSLLIVAVIFYGTWGLLRDSMNLALDAVPPGIDVDAVENYLQQLPGVTGVHDLHIWPLSTTQTALTAHLVRDDPQLDDDLLDRACHELRDHHKIHHVTLQLETTAGTPHCPLAHE